MPSHGTGARRQDGRVWPASEVHPPALLDAAHQYQKAPIVVIWNNLNIHIGAAMQQLIAARDWLHVIRLPAYGPDL
jgi:hypothetical protein